MIIITRSDVFLDIRVRIIHSQFHRLRAFRRLYITRESSSEK